MLLRRKAEVGVWRCPSTSESTFGFACVDFTSALYTCGFKMDGHWRLRQRRSSLRTK